MKILDERPTTVFFAFDFASTPPERRGLARDGTRLLVAGVDGTTDAHFHDLPDHLRPGDLVVVNDSQTIAGEWDATSPTAGPAVLHLATTLDAAHGGGVVVEARTPPDAARAVLDAEPGTTYAAGGTRVRLVEPYPDGGSSPTGRGTRLWRAEVDGDLAAHLLTHGRPIAYGYLERRYPLADYQTVFGVRPGSAEMPSAGRPFTAELVTRLVSHGIGVAPITLHTGVSSQEAGEAPLPERFAVSEATARLVNAVRAGGGRVVAVGTTVTRALESAVDVDGVVLAAAGWTNRVVTPRQPPRVVDGLVTGWHDPQASHLLLVEAVAGRELAQRAYDAAVAGRYLWHEFGDAALLLPGTAQRSGDPARSRR